MVDCIHSPAVWRGSCMARNNSIIVVIDQFDLKKCNSSSDPKYDIAAAVAPVHIHCATYS
jgi:hypothetical protein